MPANGTEGTMWTTCWWPILSQLEHLRNRRDLAFFFLADCRQFSEKGMIFVVTKQQEALHLNNVRSGNKVDCVDLLVS